MQNITFPARSEWASILARPTSEMADIEQVVQPILKRVKEEGDTALRAFALQFDKIDVTDFQVSEAVLNDAENHISAELKAAIHVAYNNIHKFHTAQKQAPEVIETMPGVECWRKSVAIQKVGLYVPGGSAPLFSTVLMLGVPSQIAGCKEVVLCTPGTHPAIYYAAKLVGITKVFRVGGAQAIAAMAYGTASIPQVYKIFGPGNQFVTAAKQLVSKEGVAIDMPAGPSEVAIYADNTAIPAFVAADLLAQAEHGADSQVLLVSTSKAMIAAVEEAVSQQLETLPRKQMAAASLENSRAILVESQATAIEMLNQYAAEHLIISVENSDEVADQITDAGSIFIGNYTPESCGDYASGTNHTLPTNGFARAYSGVSLDSFVKKITYQKISEVGLKNLGPHVEQMADAEQLEAHKQAVSIRLKSIG